jgi:hypothetical protein
VGIAADLQIPADRAQIMTFRAKKESPAGPGLKVP